MQNSRRGGLEVSKVEILISGPGQAGVLVLRKAGPDVPPISRRSSVFLALRDITQMSLVPLLPHLHAKLRLKKSGIRREPSSI